MAWTSSTYPRGTVASGAGERSRAVFLRGSAFDLARAGRLRELSQALGVAHLASLVLLLLPIEIEPFLALIVLTGSGLALAVLLPSPGGAKPGPGVPPRGQGGRDNTDLAALSPGYAAVLSALKSSEIDIGPQPAAMQADLSALADLKSEQRLSGSAALMARVSHELRTPLNAVIGFSELMKGGLFGPLGHPRYQEYARHINDSGRELLKSAEDTLALTSLLSHRDGSDEGVPVAIAPLAATAWGFFAAEAARRDICLDVRVAAHVEVVAERRALRQVLINLFAEALERAADGSSVLLFAETKGDLVEIEVGVDGTARPGDATGATLSICLARHLLELQGATLVELESSGGGDWRAVTMLDRAIQHDLFCEKVLQDA